MNIAMKCKEKRLLPKKINYECVDWKLKCGLKKILNDMIITRIKYYIWKVYYGVYGLVLVWF